MKQDKKECKLNYSLKNILSPVKILTSFFNECSVFTFQGDLGSGKTTLVKKILKYNGVTGVITSPTYTYMTCYTNNKGQKFYHFDLYRIGSLEEFILLGFDEYIYQDNSWAFIEWPEVIIPLLQKKACYSQIDYKGLEDRIMSYKFSSDISIRCK